MPSRARLQNEIQATSLTTLDLVEDGLAKGGIFPRVVGGSNS